jgi:hypothetical protein
MATIVVVIGNTRGDLSQKRHNLVYLHKGNMLLRNEFKRPGDVFSRFYAFFSKALESPVARKVVMILNSILLTPFK